MRKTKFRLSLALLSAALVLSSVSCGHPPPKLPSAPVIIATVDQDVRAAAAKALGITESLAALTLKVTQLEVQGAAEGWIPPAVDVRLKAEIRKASGGMRSFKDDVVNGAVRDWPKLKERLDPIITSVNAIVEIAHGASDGAAKKSFMDWVMVALTIALQLQGITVGGGL